MREYTKYKVAAVQAGPVFMNLDKTVNKACRFIEEAGNNGAKLIGFPEAYFSGYPWWIWLSSGASCEKYFPQFLENAVTEGDGTLSRIGECARINHIHVVIAGHERIGDSVYMTQFVFDDQGNMIGKHRKMKATAAERRVWTDGDGSTMKVYQTSIGRLGSLMCAEHHVPAYRAVLGAQNEQIHVASYPPLPVELKGTMGKNGPLNAVRTLCIENKCYAIMCCQVIDRDVVDIMCHGDESLINKLPTAISGYGGLGGGVAVVINPRGEIISDSEIDPREEGIVYGEVDLRENIIGKMYYDVYENAKKAGYMHLVLDCKEEKSMITCGKPANHLVKFSELQKSL